MLLVERGGDIEPKVVNIYRDLIGGLINKLTKQSPPVQVILFKNKEEYVEHLKEINEKLWTQLRIRVPIENIQKDIFYYGWDLPQILINLEAVEKYQKEVLSVELLMNLTHLMIHKSPSYYIIPLPEDWKDLERLMNFNRKVIDTSFYLACEGVRDYEAMRFLITKMEDNDLLFEYADWVLEKYSLKNISWKTVLQSKPLTFIILLDLFRGLASIAPVLEVFAPKKLVTKQTQILNRLPIYIKNDFAWIVTEFLPRLGNNTARNITLTTEEILANLIPGFMRMRNFLI